MSKYIHKSHNVSVLLYHLVCPAKYRKVVFSAEIDEKLKEVCLEMADRYELAFRLLRHKWMQIVIGFPIKPLF